MKLSQPITILITLLIIAKHKLNLHADLLRRDLTFDLSLYILYVKKWKLCCWGYNCIILSRQQIIAELIKLCLCILISTSIWASIQLCILFCYLLIFLKINVFKKNLAGIPSECQTVCICHAFASVHCCIVVTWGESSCLWCSLWFCYFPIWYPETGVVLFCMLFALHGLT